MTDLHELLASCAPTLERLEAARQYEITEDAFRRAGGLWIASVTFTDDTFEFEGSTRAMILPCHDGDDLLDLLAVDARRPARFARYLRRAWCLGLNWLRSPWQAGEPLVIRRTPLRWLREDAAGIVVLDWSGARDELQDCSTIVAEDVEHGRAIRRLMQHPPWKGQVMVPDPREVAA